MHLQGLGQVPVVEGDCWDNVVCQQLIWEIMNKQLQSNYFDHICEYLLRAFNAALHVLGYVCNI